MNRTNTIDFYVGIDFGAGETSASYFDLKGSQSNTNQEKLHRLSISSTGDIYTVYSAIKQQANGNWTLVTDPTDLGCREICIDFKKRVCDLTSDDKKTCIEFWKLVFDAILKNNDFLHYDKTTGMRNFQLLTARPSAWSEIDENEYLALMREAGLPVDTIVKESDAALYKWEQYSRDGSVLIVDCGSSTIDLSLVKNGQCLKDELYSCEPIPGAQYVETLLYRHFQNDQTFNEACHEVSEFLASKEIKLNLDNVLKLYLRSVKEHYYSHFPEQVCFSLRKRPFTNGPGDILDEYITREQFEDIVAPYRHKVYHFFRNVSETLSNLGNSPDTIILSGGASRMPFVKQILKEVFETDEQKFFHDKNEADFVVSDGLALLLHQNPLYGFNQEDYIVKKEDDGYKYSLVKRSGEVILASKYEEITPVRNNGTAVTVEKAIDKEFPDREAFKNKCGFERKCNYCGLFDVISKRYIIEPFNGYISFIDGTAYGIICHNKWEGKQQIELYGTIGTNGAEMIPLGKYSYLKSIKEWHSGFDSQLLIASEKGKVGIIDMQGEIVLPLIYDKIDDAGSSFYLVPIIQGEQMGLVDLRDGHIVLPCKFQQIGKYHNYSNQWRSHVYYRENGKNRYYIIDENGEMCSKVYEGLKLQLDSPIAYGLIGNAWEQFGLIIESSVPDSIKEQRVKDFEYCYNNGVSIYLKDNPQYPTKDTCVITLNDVIDYKYIIRLYRGPIKRIIFDEEECDGIFKEYSSIEKMVDDGWSPQ